MCHLKNGVHSIINSHNRSTVDNFYKVAITLSNFPLMVGVFALDEQEALETVIYQGGYDAEEILEIKESEYIEE